MGRRDSRPPQNRDGRKPGGRSPSGRPPGPKGSSFQRDSKASPEQGPKGQPERSAKPRFDKGPRDKAPRDNGPREKDFRGDKGPRDKAPRSKDQWEKGPRDQGARGKGPPGKTWDKSSKGDRSNRGPAPRDQKSRGGERDKPNRSPARSGNARSDNQRSENPRSDARPAPRPAARPAPRPVPAPAPRPAAPERPQAKPERILPPQGAEAGQASRSAAPRREEVWVYGYHPAAAALANPQRKILRIIATAELAERLRNDTSVSPDFFGQIRTMARRDIDELVGEDAVHQGIAVLTRPLEHDLHDILNGLEGQANACLVLLDQVTDPHNVGAILRSAAAFGASAVIAPDRHAPDESGVMAKSASGALDKVPYVKTGNLVRALEIIKEFQFWLVALDGEAPAALSDIDLSGRIALVFGAEGEGIRRLVAENCDHHARLPISNAMESLNVSNAAAVALYEKARQGGKR